MAEILDEFERQTHLQSARNAGLKASLISKGVILQEDRPIDVHFWASTQRDAAVVARRLYEMGFLVKLIAVSEDHRWNVEAGARIAPNRMLSDEFTETLVRLALNEEATYDGWGTSV